MNAQPLSRLQLDLTVRDTFTFTYIQYDGSDRVHLLQLEKLHLRDTVQDIPIAEEYSTSLAASSEQV